MFPFLYFFSFLALHAINKANSSEISTSVKSLSGITGISSLNVSEKRNIPGTQEFFAKIKDEEEKEEKKIFFIKLIDSINTNDTVNLSNLLSNQNSYDFSSYQDEFGYTLLDYAIINRNKKAITILFKYIDFPNFPFKKNTLLILLSFKNAQDAREFYSQVRLDEILYLAALNEQKAMITLLLFLEANPHERFFNNETAFNAAKKSKNRSILELFETQNNYLTETFF